MEQDLAVVEPLVNIAACRVDDGRARRFLAEQLHQPHLTEVVERRGRFVHDDDVWWPQQHAREAELLLFAVG